MRVIFWNVDTQCDFMLPPGKLYIKGAETITDKLYELTTFACENNIKVVNTADYHTKKSKEISATPDFKNTFPEHCMFDSAGHDFIPQTYPKNFKDNYYLIGYSRKEVVKKQKVARARNIVILKDAFNVFKGNRHTDSILSMIDPELVVVYGVAADVCVNYAVLGLLKRGYEVGVAVDAMKSLNNEPEAICRLYQSWIKEGAWLASVSTVKMIVSMRCKLQ